MTLNFLGKLQRTNRQLVYTLSKRSHHADANVHLTPHFDEFIESGIGSGRFSDASEIVCEGLRLLEERERDECIKLEWLRAATKEGFDAVDCGDFTEISSESELKSLMESVHRDAVSELARGGDV